MESINLIILIFICYILGSIPFGLLLSKIFGYGDIRKIGSGNIGTTNVLRTGNKILALAVLFFDFSKSLLPTLLIIYLYDLNLAILCGIFSIIGHIFPIWLKFKGGKGIASLFGYLLAVNQVFFLICAGIWIFIAIASKYSSLASIISVVTMVFLFFIYEDNTNIVIPLSIAIIIIFKHKENIKKLINKKENKIKIL